jgi:hypothetical protein
MITYAAGPQIDQLREQSLIGIHASLSMKITKASYAHLLHLLKRGIPSSGKVKAAGIPTF